MYQFFVDDQVEVGKSITLSKEQSHHALTVLRLHNETVRIVANEKAYYGQGHSENKLFVVDITEEDPRTNELCASLTLMMALVRREKMELILQKACELGVTKIIPFESSRCIVHQNEEKSKRVQERWNSILKESSAQCKRNLVPVLEKTVTLKELVNYKETQNFIGYENAYEHSPLFGNQLQKEATCIVIGPEGGFSEEEVKYLCEHGFEMTSFGSRILRAETAAIYALSIMSNVLEKEHEI